VNERQKVCAECAEEIAEQGKTQESTLLSSQWISASTSARYSYRFTALGRLRDIAATIVEDLPVGAHPNRPRGHCDNPKTIVWKYFETHRELEMDDSMDTKLLISAAPTGLLRRKM
jgi:cephalosporin hydroxylase